MPGDIIEVPQNQNVTVVQDPDMYQELLMFQENQQNILQEQIYYVKSGFMVLVFVSVLIVVLVFSNSFRMKV